MFWDQPGIVALSEIESVKYEWFMLKGEGLPTDIETYLGLWEERRENLDIGQFLSHCGLYFIFFFNWWVKHSYIAVHDSTWQEKSLDFRFGTLKDLVNYYFSLIQINFLIKFQVHTRASRWDFVDVLF